MPCNFLSVARARIDAKYGAELLANADALAILVKALEAVMGKVPEVVRERDGSLLLRGERTNLRITADTIQAVNVWTSKDEMAQMVRQATEIVKALAAASATERTVKGLAARYGQYAITEDRRVGQGRMVKIRVPLS
jgi:hypothetical protein